MQEPYFPFKKQKQTTPSPFQPLTKKDTPKNQPTFRVHP
jgi:hypothetical protein